MDMKNWHYKKHRVMTIYSTDYDTPREYHDAVNNTIEYDKWTMAYATTGYGDYSAFTILIKEEEK